MKRIFNLFDIDTEKFYYIIKTKACLFNAEYRVFKGSEISELHFELNLVQGPIPLPEITLTRHELFACFNVKGFDNRVLGIAKKEYTNTDIPTVTLNETEYCILKAAVKNLPKNTNYIHKTFNTIDLMVKTNNTLLEDIIRKYFIENNRVFKKITLSKKAFKGIKL